MPQVYCPVPQEQQTAVRLASRQATLAGRRVGLLGNSKPNADVLLNTAGELLRQHNGVAETLYRQKPSCSLGATEEMLDEIAAQCQAAVVALGD